MSYHKTTLFYELQIHKLLRDYDEVMLPQIKERLEGMLQNPNSKEFEVWLTENKVIE